VRMDVAHVVDIRLPQEHYLNWKETA
jgi:hypothetical protein